MTTSVDYALIAGASYFDTRNPVNHFPIPQGWTLVSRAPSDPSTGFEASTFTNGSEIVISYSGTYLSSWADLIANGGLAIGTGSAQLLQAVEYYLQVKAANSGATITLTGHSLGGGLAALVGVFFGQQAQTFDQAPFASSAWFQAPALMDYLSGKTDAQGNRLYSTETLAPLASYIEQRAAFGASPTLIPNDGLISNILVQGEFLASAPWTVFGRIGATTEAIANTAPGVSGFDLHAQSLLTAFLQSRETAAPGQALNDVTAKLTGLLSLVFDASLYAVATDKAQANFLDHLVRHQAGGIGEVPDGGDGMVTHFAADLNKLAIMHLTKPVRAPILEAWTRNPPRKRPPMT